MGQSGSSASRTGRILLVEDDENLRHVLGRVLEGHGHEVVTAADGETAVTSLGRESFDLVLSDIRLPRMSGVDVLRAVRQHDLDLPVVLMTGWPEVDTATQAVELGALQYLTQADHPERARGGRAEGAPACTRSPGRSATPWQSSASWRARKNDLAGLATVLSSSSLDSMTLVFQPIVAAVGDRTVFAYEALLRGEVSPLSRSPKTSWRRQRSSAGWAELGERTRQIASGAVPSLPKDTLLFINLRARDLLDHGLSLLRRRRSLGTRDGSFWRSPSGRR